MPSFPVARWLKVAETTLATYRPATGSEADAMAAIHAQCWPRPWQAADFETFFTDPATQISLSHRGPRLAGFCIIRQAADEAELLMIAIDPIDQRGGTGLGLLHHGLERLRGSGAVTCFLEVGATNHPAIGLYTRAGFAEVGRRKGYYPPAAAKDVPEDAIIMRFDLA
jgi:[ribosomal protein S18]-alanine N-acetyltransferase